MKKILDVFFKKSVRVEVEQNVNDEWNLSRGELGSTSFGYSTPEEAVRGAFSGQTHSAIDHASRASCLGTEFHISEFKPEHLETLLDIARRQCAEFEHNYGDDIRRIGHATL